MRAVAEDAVVRMLSPDLEKASARAKRDRCGQVVQSQGLGQVCPPDACARMSCVDMDGLRAAMCLGLGSVLGTEVPTNAPLMSMGLDSIAAVEFTNAVSEKLGMTFSAIMLFDYPTLDSIASYLAAELETDPVEEDEGAILDVEADTHAVPGRPACRAEVMAP